ncbi:GNAT family N-acetyltransferase [Salipaludibacillus sp. HK11]|uniref:GNAT family N-acetyltransferase n=1 Tax=Salipaludibacillus sp. HK11 TaxID=3394320 RepID=UPI0039FDA3B5
MLIPIKKEHEKIAMGLLSFMPRDNKGIVVQKVLKMYETSPNHQLYLYKNEKDRFVGVVGVEDLDGSVYITDLTVDPSHRNEGLGSLMIKMIEDMKSIRVLGTNDTELFVKHYQNQS